MSTPRSPAYCAARPGLLRGYAAVQSIGIAAGFASLLILAFCYGELATGWLAAGRAESFWAKFAHVFSKLQIAVTSGYCAGAGLTLIGAFTNHRIVNTNQVKVVAVIGGLIALC